MKPADFDFVVPTSLAEAIALLEQHGDDAKILAGGQSLVPIMHMRLARPALLIDINGLTELSSLRLEGGYLHIGGLVRHRELEQSETIRTHLPLLAEVARHIGHPAIRNRGTVGGSLAHADPAAELPLAMIAVCAEFELTGSSGTRLVKADEFFAGYFLTALAPGEILTAVRVPLPPKQTRYGFAEFTRRHGDFAIVAVLALLTQEGSGMVTEARIAAAGASPAPLRLREAESVLLGRRPTPELIAQAGALAAAETDPESDIHAPAEYRRELTGVLTRRVLTAAVSGGGVER